MPDRNIQPGWEDVDTIETSLEAQSAAGWSWVLLIGSETEAGQGGSKGREMQRETPGGGA